MNSPTRSLPANDEVPCVLLARWCLMETTRWVVHIGAFVGVFLVGISPTAMLVFGFLWLLSALGTTMCYHRYFGHRAFRTSRGFQFLLALWGATSLQRGPVWWAAVHREHHAYADTDRDWHTPRRGFYHSHMGWLSSPRTFMVNRDRVKDLSRYPELMWLENWFFLPNVVIIGLLIGLGGYLEANHPLLGTDAWQLVVWGFFVRVTVVWQMTFAVNSLLHGWGTRRFETPDKSTNGPLWFALLTLGDAYHNNHHRFPQSACHGCSSYEVDLTYQLVRVLERLGVVWDVRMTGRTECARPAEEAPEASML